jgi:hypothetical protein
MRPRGANTRSKLLCPICAEIKKVVAIDEDRQITLSCLHVRPEILAPSQGHLSLEHLKTERGQRCFPLERANRL